MRITLTGATGFVGRPLCRALAARGHQLVVLTRSPDKARGVLGGAPAIHAWDGVREAPSGALAGADVVVHLAGEGVAEHRWTAAQKARIRDSRVLGARGLLHAIARGDWRPRALISASAIGIYGDRGDEVLTERSEAGDGFLASVCRDWEAEVAKAAELGLREARVRVGMVLGLGGGALHKLVPLFRAGLGGPVGSGRQWISWIHLDDLVELFVRAIEEEAYRGAYNGVGPTPVTNREFAHALGRALHRPAVLPAPAFAVRLAMGEMAGLVLEGQRIVPERALATGFAFRYPTLDAALGAVVKTA